MTLTKRGNLTVHLPPGKKVKAEPDESTDSAPMVVEINQHDGLPPDFLEPLEHSGRRDSIPHQQIALPQSPSSESTPQHNIDTARQFWKAGDYETGISEKRILLDGLDHIRVHPKFLHSNATSHKWALGAIAELLDNALDEIVQGATFVNVDVLHKQGHANPMLLFEDDGGGMDPDCMRRCMSLGYSAKSKMKNMIGQYGNGFKTSTMRLGADVIVFSSHSGKDSNTATSSIGLLSYTFLRQTCQQDIIVPMIDFEAKCDGLQRVIRGDANDWERNMDIIKKWSPFSTEKELFEQLNRTRNHGTRIIIYNLWQNDQGQLELDFEADRHDIQLRGVNRDPRIIAMAERLPNSRHFLNYKHSLRSYASILYLRLPKTFKMILRGVDIEHHSLANDLMIKERHVYKPYKRTQKDDEEPLVPSDTKTVITIGFVKDAKEHMDVQGFNVYHKNRLIKPFWRVWNASSSQGRGIIGVLEANFVEPAHDKQGFERTSVLARLETRLLRMQKTYWASYSHKIGYCNIRAKKKQNVQRTAKNSNVAGDLFPKGFPRSSRSHGQRMPAQRYLNKRSNRPPQFSCPSSSGHSSEVNPVAIKILCGAFPLENGNHDSLGQDKQAIACQQTQSLHLDAAQKIKWLEAQVLMIEQQLKVAQIQMEVAFKERDELKQELEEERRRGEARDTELRKKLKDTIQRVKELECLNKQLQSTQYHST